MQNNNSTPSIVMENQVKTVWYVQINKAVLLQLHCYKIQPLGYKSPVTFQQV
jgi:hypothetical protein